VRAFGKAYLRGVIAVGILGVITPWVLPASPAAAAGLGGYNASAEASSVRIAIYEPAIPIPSTPQVDASLGYARSTTSTGPTSRALSSYLWPGDAIGDGLGTLLGNEADAYPVKVDSKYPASATAPAHNTAQLTDGNGMTTSADATTTQATTTGLEVGTNLLSGLGQGMCSLFHKTCATLPGLPLPAPLSTIASLDNAKTQSTTTLTDTSITATASSTVSGLTLLGGLITIKGVHMTASSTSNGAKGADTGDASVVGLEVLGKAVSLGDPISLAGNDTPAPKVPIDLSSQLGIKIEYLTNSGAVSPSTYSVAADRNVQGLTITVDLGVLGKVLGNGALSTALAPLLGKIPQLGPLLVGLLKLGTKLVITVGDVRTSVSGTPAYVGGGFPGGTTLPPTSPGSSAGGPIVSSGGVPTLDQGAAVPPGQTATPSTTTPVTQAAFQFPGLGKTPSMLILLCLLAAGLAGWVFRAVGLALLGGEDCAMGLAVGVPDLRQGASR
jgi:hypothetical protein